MAIACDKIKMIYISSWRTGCTSVECFLKNHYEGRLIGHKHSTLDEALEALPKEEYFCVTNIRNPYDSLVSFYFKCKFRYYPILKKDYNAIGEEFISEELKEIILQVDNRSFEDFLLFLSTTPSGGRLPSGFARDSRFHFICLEDLQADLDKAFLKIGIKNKHKLQHKNPTEVRDQDYKKYYTPLARDIADSLTQEYREATKYTFDGRFNVNAK